MTTRYLVTWQTTTHLQKHRPALKPFNHDRDHTRQSAAETNIRRSIDRRHWKRRFIDSLKYRYHAETLCVSWRTSVVLSLLLRARVVSSLGNAQSTALLCFRAAHSRRHRRRRRDSYRREGGGSAIGHRSGRVPAARAHRCQRQTSLHLIDGHCHLLALREIHLTSVYRLPRQHLTTRVALGSATEPTARCGPRICPPFPARWPPRWGATRRARAF